MKTTNIFDILKKARERNQEILQAFKAVQKRERAFKAAPVVKPGDSGTRPGWLRTGRRSGRPNQYKLLC